jgi:protein SCO1/2
MKNQFWKKLIIPFVILLFPVALWLVLVTGHNHFKTLPILGPIQVSEKGDTSYHTIPAFAFTNQNGQTVGSKDLENQIYVANFFFASCKSVCPQMNEQMGKVQFAFKDEKDFHILSFTVDPENDSVATLAAYAERMRADNSKWWFLTGDKDSLYSVARDGFLVPAAEGKTKDDFFHSQDIILIDKQKRIRGVYDGLDVHEIDSLIDHTKLLFQEYREKKQ